VLGILRFLKGWSLKPLIYLTLVPTILLTTFAMWGREHLWVVIGLAWDCGAVTTGPVTVPIILAIGIGVISSQKDNQGGAEASPLSGFGIVTLASLYPILAVEFLGVFLSFIHSTDDLKGFVDAELSKEKKTYWYDESPWHEIVYGIRAITPLIILLAIILRVILRENWPVVKLFPAPGESNHSTATEEDNKKPWMQRYRVFFVGIICAQGGMCLFNIGLTFGLSALGRQAGTLLPGAFQVLPAVEGTPFYSYHLGIFIVLFFGWFLGFLATIAEPALNVLGMKVESLTNGEFSKNLLIYSVSFGVAFGIALGLLKIIFGIPLIYMIYVGYVLAVTATYLSNEDFVNVAWDSAGVTTGPVTVPFVLTLGLSVGSAVHAEDGFGILTLASIGPILSVLCTGLFQRLYRWTKRRIAKSYSHLDADVEMNTVPDTPSDVETVKSDPETRNTAE